VLPSANPAKKTNLMTHQVRFLQVCKYQKLIATPSVSHNFVLDLREFQSYHARNSNSLRMVKSSGKRFTHFFVCLLFLLQLARSLKFRSGRNQTKIRSKTRTSKARSVIGGAKQAQRAKEEVGHIFHNNQRSQRPEGVDELKPIYFLRTCQCGVCVGWKNRHTTEKKSDFAFRASFLSILEF
jgi:hypothetical protein